MRSFAPSVALLLLAACSGSGSGGAPDVPFGQPPYAAVDPAGAPVEGPADAWVTIVEFLDYACPYCAQARPVLEEVRAAHAADVRVIAKMFPVHGDLATRAARGALCAHEQDPAGGPDALFWLMHESLFAHAPAFSDAQVASYAAAIEGINITAWQACYDSAASLDAVDADFEIGLGIGVSGTPTFAINGKLVQGKQDTDAMDQLVREAQSAAQASGIPRAEYYDKVILGR